MFSILHLCLVFFAQIEISLRLGRIELREVPDNRSIRSSGCPFLCLVLNIRTRIKGNACDVIRKHTKARWYCEWEWLTYPL